MKMNILSANMSSKLWKNSILKKIKVISFKTTGNPKMAGYFTLRSKRIWKKMIKFLKKIIKIMRMMGKLIKIW